MENELDVRYNNILISGRKDETLTYSKYVKDKSSGRGLDEIVDDKVSKTDQLTTSQLADGSVTTEKIATGAVTSDQLQYDTVKNEHIGDDAVTTDKLFDGCVQTEKLEDHAVTMEKLADGSVVNKKLAPGAVSATKIADQAVLVSKIADEVWEKLKQEYLRLDGANSMKGHLFLGDHDVLDVRNIYQNGIGLGAVISLSNTDEIILKTVEADSDEEPYHRILADFQEGVVSFPDGEVLSNGYKTIDRTNIGLLVNDGSVSLAMSDSDIDGLFQHVFQTVIG